MIDLSFLDVEFRTQIMKHIPGNKYEDLMFDVKNNIALIRDNNNVQIIGCKLCLLNEIKQDNLGDLYIGHRKLINGNDKKEFLNLPQEIKNNIWLCPGCEKPFKDRMIKL